MFDRRTKNVMIFKDTEQMYQSNENLKVTVEKSIMNQKLILFDDVIDYKVSGGHAGKVVMSGKRTLEASETYAKSRKFYRKQIGGTLMSSHAQHLILEEYQVIT